MGVVVGNVTTFELALIIVCAGGIGAALGYFAGVSAGMRGAARHVAPPAAMPAEPRPPVQRYEPPLQRDDVNRQPPPRPATRVVAPQPRAVPRLPIVDDRRDEDRTVFRKLKKAQDAFRDSLDHLKGRQDDQGPAADGSVGDKPKRS